MKFKGDKEYSTMFLKEVTYLNNNNIKPSYMHNNINGIKTYKYTKTSKLFDLLSLFYKDNLWK